MKKKIKIILFITVFFLLLIYLYIQNNILIVTYYEIKNSKINSDFNNFKIVHLTDIHNTNSTRLSTDIVKVIEEEKPNIIVITGDLIDSNTPNVNRALEIVNSVIEYAPVYYVTGNHEALTDKYIELRDGLIDLGVKILDNEVVQLYENDSFINIVGVVDPTFYNTDNEMIMKKNLDEINIDNAVFTILLSHRPELFSIYVSHKYDLVFVGHAHGGQIRIPFIGGLVAPNQGLFPKYTSGIFCDENTSMIINRGIGNSVLPFRINDRPEVVVIKLRSDD